MLLKSLNCNAIYMNIRIGLILLLIFFVVTTTTQTNPRLAHSNNNDWNSHEGDLPGMPFYDGGMKWEKVSIPHTWNAGMSWTTRGGYYRGICWYKHQLIIPSTYRDKRLFLHFEGANQETEVFVNGSRVGHHKGGYTGFTFEISDLLNYAKGTEGSVSNKLLVKVDNSFNH